jgi:hypothetical protein
MLSHASSLSAEKSQNISYAESDNSAELQGIKSDDEILKRSYWGKWLEISRRRDLPRLPPRHTSRKGMTDSKQTFEV